MIRSVNALIRELSKEAAEKARKTMDFDSFKPGDAIEVRVGSGCEVLMVR